MIGVAGGSADLHIIRVLWAESETLCMVYQRMMQVHLD